VLTIRDRAKALHADVAAISTRDAADSLPSQHRLSLPVLSSIGDDTQDVPRFENLLNRHRDRSRRNFVQTVKPTFTCLLPSTSFIERNHEIRFFCLEICRRVVECQVAILPDANKRQIDRVL